MKTTRAQSMNNTMTKTEKRPAETQPVEPQPRPCVAPRVNITETKEGYLLEAEMPGVNKDGIDIALEGNELTLTGRRHEETHGLDPVYKESTGRDYRRSFVLDLTIDTSRIEAKMDNGVLRLHLPKAEQVKPRKIKVTE